MMICSYCSKKITEEAAVHHNPDKNDYICCECLHEDNNNSIEQCFRCDSKFRVHDLIFIFSFGIAMCPFCVTTLKDELNKTVEDGIEKRYHFNTKTTVWDRIK